VVDGTQVRDLLAFLRGVGEKVVSKTWFLDGEFVMECVVFVVVWNHVFSA
jgi:hypothetical protein